MATNLIRRVEDPFDRELITLRNAMNRLWEDPFAPVRLANWTSGYDLDLPSVDVEEKPSTYVVTAALPGWKPEDVEITYESGRVTISGELKQETAAKDGNGKDGKYHRKEIVQKSFTRSFELPSEADVAKASAAFANGMLTITLPKSDVIKPVHIKIAAKP